MSKYGLNSPAPVLLPLFPSIFSSPCPKALSPPPSQAPTLPSPQKEGGGGGALLCYCEIVCRALWGQEFYIKKIEFCPKIGRHVPPWTPLNPCLKPLPKFPIPSPCSHPLPLFLPPVSSPFPTSCPQSLFLPLSPNVYNPYAQPLSPPPVSTPCLHPMSPPCPSPCPHPC